MECGGGQCGVRVFRIGTESKPAWALTLTILWVSLLGLLASVSQAVAWSVQSHLLPCVVGRIHWDDVHRALERGWHGVPTQSVVTNIISSVEQTHFAGASQHRHSNMLSVHVNLIYWTFLAFWATVSIYRQGAVLAPLTLTGGASWGPRDCPFLKMVMPHSPRGGQQGPAKCAQHGSCGQQGWHSPCPRWAR